MSVVDFSELQRATPTRAGFSSSKCLAMQYPRRACRDFLVLASLDPATRLIRAVSLEPGVRPADCYFSIQMTRSKGELIVMLCDNSDGYRNISGHPPAVAIPRQALNSTAIETARLIWSRRKHLIDPAYSVLIQKRLAREGELTFADAIYRQGSVPLDAVDQIMALACRGLVDFHIDGNLKPETRITPPAGRQR